MPIPFIISIIKDIKSKESAKKLPLAMIIKKQILRLNDMFLLKFYIGFIEDTKIKKVWLVKSVHEAFKWFLKK